MTTASAPPPEEAARWQMVLLPTPPPGGFTASDLPRLIEAVDARFELLDGEVLMTRPVVIATEKIIDWGHSMPEPDVLAVLRAAVKSDSLFFQPGDVHLAIEVSPDVAQYGI
jgi:hypothetical protein